MAGEDKQNRTGALRAELKIQGDMVKLSLLEKETPITSVSWTDRRDLSSKFFIKLEKLLAGRGLAREDISRVDFSCDSPYFFRKDKELVMLDLDSSGKCGFTAWQTGEIIAETINFALK